MLAAYMDEIGLMVKYWLLFWSWIKLLPCNLKSFNKFKFAK